MSPTDTQKHHAMPPSAHFLKSVISTETPQRPSPWAESSLVKPAPSHRVDHILKCKGLIPLSQSREGVSSPEDCQEHQCCDRQTAFGPAAWSDLLETVPPIPGLYGRSRCITQNQGTCYPTLESGHQGAYRPLGMGPPY